MTKQHVSAAHKKAGRVSQAHKKAGHVSAAHHKNVGKMMKAKNISRNL